MSDVATARATAAPLGKLPEAAPSSVKGAWTMTKLTALYLLGFGLIRNSAISLPLRILIAAMALSGFFMVGVDCSRRSLTILSNEFQLGGTRRRSRGSARGVGFSPSLARAVHLRGTAWGYLAVLASLCLASWRVARQ
jgi:hypothetical protein